MQTDTNRTSIEVKHLGYLFSVEVLHIVQHQNDPIFGRQIEHSLAEQFRLLTAENFLLRAGRFIFEHAA